MNTYYCKACKKLEQTERKVNVFSCSEVIIDGVKYLACYLHPAKPGEHEQIPGGLAVRFVSDRYAADQHKLRKMIK